jgi:hypothetical protein
MVLISLRLIAVGQRTVDWLRSCVADIYAVETFTMQSLR